MEEHVFILQQMHSFIIEHLLCVWYGAKAKAVNSSPELPGTAGKEALTSEMPIYNAHGWAS